MRMKQRARRGYTLAELEEVCDPPGVIPDTASAL